MNPFLITATVAALATAGLPAVASAAPAETAPTGTKCHGEMSWRAEPGLGLKGTRGQVLVPSGTFTCDGPVRGKHITGPGTVTGSTRYGVAHPDSCTTGGEGTELFHFALPTSTGTLRIDNRGTYSFQPFSKAGLFAGEFDGDHISGTFTATPTRGDCVTSPVTAGTLTYLATVHD